MASGDFTLFEPGERVTVTLVADSAGNVAGLNDFVEITGENSQHTEVSVVETTGAGVAELVRLPREYDEDAAYAAGDVVGEATVLLRHAVDWAIPNDGWDQTATDPSTTSPAAGDLAISAAGGVVQLYDPAGNDAAGVVGPVWTTISKGNYTTGKIAVVRQN